MLPIICRDFAVIPQTLCRKLESAENEDNLKLKKWKYFLPDSELQISTHPERRAEKKKHFSEDTYPSHQMPTNYLTPTRSSALETTASIPSAAAAAALSTAAAALGPAAAAWVANKDLS